MNTVLCYITDSDKVLLLHRNKKQQDINAGKWVGIGGKFEPRESPEEALLREVKEETGLTLTRYTRRGVVTFVQGDFTEYMFLFTADAFEGELADCDEGDLRWVNVDSMFSLPMWQGDAVFLKRLWEDDEYFSLKLVYEGDTLVDSVFL